LKDYSLIGLILPSNVNVNKDTTDGILVAQRLGIKYVVISIESTVKAMVETLGSLNPFDNGNMISRVRANFLNTISATSNKVLLGTGNKDEDFGVGYYTLYGDGAVHCSPIGRLSKRHVFQLARHLGFADIANKLPSAGLEVEQTSYGDLGYDYYVVELFLEAFEQGNLEESRWTPHKEVFDKPEVFPQIVQACQPYLGKKFNTIREIGQDVLRSHKLAKAKMEILHPPMPEVNFMYVGEKKNSRYNGIVMHYVE